MTTKPVPNEVVEKQLAWRYATKVFDATRKISAEDWHTLEQSLVLTPSSFGLQPWKFIVVTDPAVKAALKPATYNQSQVVDASHVVVLAIQKNLSVVEIDRYVERTAEVRGVTVESLVKFRQSMVVSLTNPPFDINEWAVRQVYIALGFLMSAAAMLGIDTCPIEGFHPAKYDEILGLAPLGLSAAVVAAAGYRSENCKYAAVPKVRFKTDDVIIRI
jgi:nitroreductase